MRYSLFFIFVMVGLYSQPSYISKGGEGLYFDAAFAPMWRNDRSSDSIINSTASAMTDGFSRLVSPGFYNLSQSGNTYAPGIRVRADLAPSRKASIQAVYLGLYDWSFKDHVGNSVNMGISIYPYGDWPFGPNYLFQSLRNIRIEYNEHFNSIEGSYLNHLTPRYYDYFSVAALIGLRGMKHDSSLEMGSIPNALSGEPTVDREANLYLKNENTFVGAQLGLILKYRFTRRIYIDIPLKGGLYADVVDSQIWIRYPDYAAPSYVVKDLVKRTSVRAAAGYSFETIPKVELHIGYGYLFAGGSCLYVHGVSPINRQITGYDLDKTACGGFILYGAIIGAGIHI
ncbi:MAG: hypothetical protein S4CHLAM20_13780 [Chlamydiia bacterium]|nr:hypothetical protein [Chlamydiia bacterium]